MTALVLRGDARALPLPDASVDLIVTSPPYWALRSYTDGGEHYDGQIGSEATPAAYIGALLDCTREWVRVLKPSGSLFVNLGDVYSRVGGGGVGSSDGKLGRGARPSRRVVGREMTRTDAAWLAGVIDSDGSVSIHVNRQPEGNAPSFVAWTRIGQMRPEVVQRAAEVTGVGQVYKDSRGVWNWSASAQQARWVLQRIYPWLLIKKQRAAAAIEVARHVEERNGRGSYRPLTPEDVAYRQRLRDAVKSWNASDQDPLDVPEPVHIPLPDYPNGPREKSLVGLPWRYALGCIDQLGLTLHAELIWSKPNGLPESVTDRVRRSHEQWFHMTRGPRYFAAVDEIREATTGRGALTWEQRKAAGEPMRQGEQRRTFGEGMAGNPLGKLPGSVWDIPSEPLTVPDHLGVDHFAAFPTEWPKRIIAGWSPSGICTACGEGRRPTVDATPMVVRPSARRLIAQANGNAQRTSTSGTVVRPASRAIAGYACACPDDTAPTRPAVVLDPFGGTGTVALVAAALGRTGISIDMSADYCRLAQWRTNDPAQRAKVLGLTKPPTQITGQGDLLAEIGAAS